MGIVPHFKMEMGSGRPSRVAHVGDALVLFHSVSFFDPDLGIVGVNSGQVIFVFNDDHLPVTCRSPSAELDFSCGRSHDRCSFGSSDIDAIMVVSPSLSEPGGQQSLHRPDQNTLFGADGRTLAGFFGDLFGLVPGRDG